MTIGILKEAHGENRVAMLPDSIEALSGLHIKVLIEIGAGEQAFTSNELYQAAGATIESKAHVIEQSAVLLKINPPTPEEVALMHAGQVLVCALNPFFNLDLVQSLAEKNITVFSLDVIPRTTRAQAMDILSSQATVAGYKAVLEAAATLPNFFPMFMSAAGTIRPSKILVLGAGVAGLQAIATARKLGAVVEVFDVRTAVKEEVESLGGKFIEVEGAQDDTGAGGYAIEQSEAFKALQKQAIHDHASKANVVICTAQIPGRKAPLLITKETVEAMQPGSIVIDLAASSGGNCALTENNKTHTHQQVKIIGNSHYPSEMPVDSSKMFGKNLLTFIKLLINEKGELLLNFEDELVKGTCITHDNAVVHMRVKESITT